MKRNTLLLIALLATMSVPLLPRPHHAQDSALSVVPQQSSVSEATAGASPGNDSSPANIETDKLRDLIVDLELQLPGAVERLGAEHPSVASLEKRLATARRLLANYQQREQQQVEQVEQRVDHSQDAAAMDERMFQSLVNVLRRANAPERAKEVARQKLAEVLQRQIERDLADKESQLRAAEDKIKSLRDQLETRKQNKSKVVEVLVLLAENPSAGIGIPQSWYRSIMPVRPEANDPFSNDPFSDGSAGTDPFSAGATDDPFGAAPSADPFGAGVSNDPFGASRPSTPSSSRARNVPSQLADPFSGR